jgi:hypothetical protein
MRLILHSVISVAFVTLVGMATRGTISALVSHVLQGVMYLTLMTFQEANFNLATIGTISALALLGSTQCVHLTDKPY